MNRTNPVSGMGILRKMGIVPTPSRPWRVRVEELFKNISFYGLLTPREASKLDTPMLRSESADDTLDAVAGRDIRYDSDPARFPLMLDDVLYNLKFGVVSVLSERPDYLSMEGLSPSEDELVGHGVVVVVRKDNIQTYPCKGETRINGSVRASKIDYILVPEKFMEIAASVFRVNSLKLVVVNGKINRKSPLSSRAVDIPDFESALSRILRDNQGVDYWLHGVRVPHPQEAELRLTMAEQRQYQSLFAAESTRILGEGYQTMVLLPDSQED